MIGGCAVLHQSKILVPKSSPSSSVGVDQKTLVNLGGLDAAVAEMEIGVKKVREETDALYPLIVNAIQSAPINPKHGKDLSDGQGASENNENGSPGNTAPSTPGNERVVVHQQNVYYTSYTTTV